MTGQHHGHAADDADYPTADYFAGYLAARDAVRRMRERGQELPQLTPEMVGRMLDLQDEIESTLADLPRRRG